ncbi:MAG: TonB-dependent receptor [Bacteroidetes bacterium]|nr:TonB-dependent receptor [Bacteroidota bacterium]
MKKGLNLLVFLLLCQITLVAKGQVQLLAADDSIPVPFAKISFCDSTGVPYSYTRTDGTGRFELPVSAPAIFETQIDAVGFETAYRTKITADTRVVFLPRNTTLDVVCVTTQYQPTTLSNSVQRITVINSEQIEKSGAVTLAEVINYQTGIRISQDNVLGTSMNIGGISGENVKILIDGVPVIGRLNGSVDLGQINLNTIERIEVIEGPLSVNYGTNALAGTINLITKKELKKGIHVALNPYYENTGNYNFNFSSTLTLKKNAFSISGGRNYFDGWSAGDSFFKIPRTTVADTNRYQTWKPKEQYFGEVRYNTRLNGWDLNPYVRTFSEKIVNRGFPNSPYYETAFDDYYYTNRNDAGMIVSKIFPASRLNTQIAFNHFQRIKNTYFNDLTTLIPVLSETTGAQDTAIFSLLNLRVTFNSATAKKFNYEFGTDVNSETAYGLRIEGKHKTMQDYALFSTASWKPFKNFTVKPGLRYAYNSIYQAPLIPSVHLHYRINKWTFRASVARGFRAPSLKELYFDFVDINHNIQGNTELQAERSVNYHLSFGWMHQTPKNLFIKLESSVYFNDITNLITLGMNGTNTYSYINIGRYKTQGNTLAFTLRKKSISIQVNGSYIGRYNNLSDDTGTNPFTFSPEAGTQVSWYLWNEKLSINLFYKFNGAIRTFYLDDNEAITTSTQQSYQILDLSFNLKLLKNTLHITAGARNLFNVTTVGITGESGGVHSGGNSLNTARGIAVFTSVNYQLDFSFKTHEKGTL